MLRVTAKGYALKDGIHSLSGSEYQVLDVAGGGGNQTELRIELIPFGTISGTVRDANDIALPGVRVVALRKNFNTRGEPVLSLTNIAAQTNPAGEYVLGGLHTGEYFVKVEGQPPAYYPGTRDSRDAAPVIVGPSTVSTFGINVRLPAEKLVRLRGQVVTGDVNEAGVRADQLYLISASSDGGDIRTGNNISTDAQGRFEFADVVPGMYDIAALVEAAGRRLYGKATVEVRHDDIDEIRIRLYPAITLTGRIRVRSSNVPNDLSKLSVTFTPTGGRVPGLKEGLIDVNAEGSFAATIFPGDYRISAVIVPRGLYVESIKLDNLDVLERIAPVAPTASTLEVTLAGPSFDVSGKVLLDNGQAALDASMVALVPLQPAGDDLSSSIKVTVTTLRGGDYAFQNIAPGRYRVLAFQNVTNGFPVYNREFLDQFVSKGTLVTVDGSTPFVVANTLVIAIRR
jgi:hypothetical protein